MIDIKKIRKKKNMKEATAEERKEKDRSEMWIEINLK
jgi:hypothetical protein